MSESKIFSDDEDMDGVYDDVSKVSIDNHNISRAAPQQSMEENPVFLYRMFYNRLFPFKPYFNWLNYGTSR